MEFTYTSLEISLMVSSLEAVYSTLLAEIMALLTMKSEWLEIWVGYSRLLLLRLLL